MLVDARIPFSGEMKEVKILDAKPVSSVTALGNCLSLGMLAAPFAATKTQLRPSLVSGVLQTPTMKPAYLRPSTLVDGTFCDPMNNGIKKVLNTTVPLDLDMLEIVQDDVFHQHIAYSLEARRVLSFEEAVGGVEDAKYLTPLNRTSSPGYPYTLDNTGPGKRAWFGYTDVVYSGEVRKDVEDLLVRCRNNQRGDVVWQATLKDERRPIEKVEQGKTRVFAAGPMHYTIAVRQYFLKFVEHLMENRIFNEIGVGTNVYSIDWHHTGVALCKYGNKVIAGDFSNFDGSLLQGFLWAICDLINKWYDDGPENAQIRCVLFEEICNARVLVNGELIQWDHFQPSGNPLTVIVNSLFNQMVMRYAYLLCKKSVGKPIVCDFTHEVSMQTYGDDNVLNISDNVVDWYNQLTITDALATIGLTYTDEGKTGQLVPFRTLDEVAYLKRTFVMNEHGYYTAPLDQGVCAEMVNWIRGTSGAGKEETFNNAEASIREFYFHGKERFNEVRNQIGEALRGAEVEGRLPTFGELRSFYNSEYFNE
jgi:hypothetical protein